MLKAYAIALVLTTAAPVADKPADGAKAPVKADTQTTQYWKPRGVKL